MARHTKKVINCERSWQCHCLFYICSKDKNKIVSDGGEASAFRSHKITWKQYLENGEYLVSCHQLLHLSRTIDLIF